MKIARIAVFVIACAGLLFAQMDSSKAEGKTKMKSDAKTLTGKLVSVDLVANTIVVKTKKAEDTLEVAPDAMIKKGKSTIAIGDLATDSHVTVTWKMESDKKMATKITEKVMTEKKTK